MGRILIVDDSEMSRTILENRVGKLGHAADTAASGLEAVVKIAGEAYDAVLLDVVMEDMDGHAVLTALARQGKLDGLPVVVVSGIEDESERARCLEAGARAFIKKPLDPDRLDAILTELLGTDGLAAEPCAPLSGSVSATPEIDPVRLKAAGRKSPLERAWGFERDAPLLLQRIADHLDAHRTAMAAEACAELESDAQGVGLMQVADGCRHLIGSLDDGGVQAALDRLRELVNRGRDLLRSHKSEL